MWKNNITFKVNSESVRPAQRKSFIQETNNRWYRNVTLFLAKVKTRPGISFLKNIKSS